MPAGIARHSSFSPREKSTAGTKAKLLIQLNVSRDGYLQNLQCVQSLQRGCLNPVDENHANTNIGHKL